MIINYISTMLMHILSLSEIITPDSLKLISGVFYCLYYTPTPVLKSSFNRLQKWVHPIDVLNVPSKIKLLNNFFGIYVHHSFIFPLIVVSWIFNLYFINAHCHPFQEFHLDAVCIPSCDLLDPDPWLIKGTCAGLNDSVPLRLFHRWVRSHCTRNQFAGN